VAVLDVPLLFEAGWDKLAEESWLVYVPEDEQLRRLCLRDKCNAEQALRRIRAQMPLEEKMARAEVTIDNSGTMAVTRRIVKDLWKERIHEQFA
jgi:dephospho-CoA kinase